jgi:hypothetical protein
MKSHSGQCRCKKCEIEIFFSRTGVLEWKNARDPESFTFMIFSQYVLFDKFKPVQFYDISFRVQNDYEAHTNIRLQF